MTMLLRTLVLLSCVLLVHAAEPDQHKDCQGWADRGECEANPNFMLQQCATSCEKVLVTDKVELEKLNAIDSVFDLSANDIDGNVVDFNQFRGQVTILTNVASFCGYTDSHYQSLVQLYQNTKSSSINILAFPCNQFGHQEPGTAQEIKDFVKQKQVQFTMMEKINVNGSDAHLLYKYLKRQTGIARIQWNFATYFVIGPDGTVTAHSGVEPLELESQLFDLLKEEL